MLSAVPVAALDPTDPDSGSVAHYGDPAREQRLLDTAAALVDRILHHGEVFYLKGPSWRVKGRSVDGDFASSPSAHGNGTEPATDARHRVAGPEDAVR